MTECPSQQADAMLCHVLGRIEPIPAEEDAGKASREGDRERSSLPRRAVRRTKTALVPGVRSAPDPGSAEMAATTSEQ